MSIRLAMDDLLNKKFEVISPFSPSGDQPKAIKELTERINGGEKDIILLGATGTGKSATAAWLIELCNAQR